MFKKYNKNINNQMDNISDIEEENHNSLQSTLYFKNHLLHEDIKKQKRNTNIEKKVKNNNIKNSNSHIHSNPTNALTNFFRKISFNIKSWWNKEHWWNKIPDFFNKLFNKSYSFEHALKIEDLSQLTINKTIYKEDEIENNKNSGMDIKNNIYEKYPFITGGKDNPVQSNKNENQEIQTIFTNKN